MTRAIRVSDQVNSAGIWGKREGYARENRNFDYEISGQQPYRPKTLPRRWRGCVQPAQSLRQQAQLADFTLQPRQILHTAQRFPSQ
jgi:hypothetical protein